MQCFRCGKEYPESRLLSGLCADCFVETERPLTLAEHITVLQCASCGSILRGKTWLKPKEVEDLVEHALRENLSARNGVEVVSVGHTRGRGDERSFDLKVEAQLQVAGKSFALT